MVLHRSSSRMKNDEMVLELLCSVDIEKHHINTSIMQQPQTTTWFTNGEVLQKLVDGNDKVLWVHGKHGLSAGSGKTVLFSSIVNKLRKERPQSYGFAYFYCDYRDPRSRNTLTILGGLLKSLARQNKEVAEGLVRAFGAKCRPNSQVDDLSLDDLSLDDLKASLTAASRHFSEVWILVDAIDEAQDTAALISLFHELMLSPGNTFKLVITSRRETDIEAEFGNFPSVELNQDTNQAGIYTYVSKKIEQRVQKGNFPMCDSFLKEAIITQLVFHSGGLFQWTTSQLDNLFLLRAAEFLYIIQNCCLSCDATILKAKLSRENTQTLFQGLVEINPETQAYQFSHYSIHEFLTSDTLRSTSLREYTVESEHAHRRLARLCLKALMSYESDASTEFYDYASVLWMEHAKRADPDSDLDSEIARFLSEGQFSDWRDKSSFANWMSYSEEKKVVPFRSNYHPCKAFLQALIFGRDTVTARLINNGLHRIRDPCGYTVPIVDAVIHGASKEIISMLIEYGSNVNDVRFGSQTALIWAVQKEEKELITFLLDNGADVNKITDEDQVGGSAFNQAILYGSPEIVLFLIEKGADVHQPVLLQNSGDVCESKGRYGTVLHLAVEQHDIDTEDVVQLLLRHGAEVVINVLVPNNPNLESGPSTNPLHRAILENSVGTVEILIERGATGHSKYGPYVSALECAAYAGHGHLFRKILKFSSTKPRTSTDLSRILQRAIVGGHFSILGQALQEGVNAQDQDEIWRSKSLNHRQRCSGGKSSCSSMLELPSRTQHLAALELLRNRKIRFGLKGSLPKNEHMIGVIGSYFYVSGAGVTRLPKVEVADTIGCGYDWAASEIYLTLNGELLGELLTYHSTIMEAD
ncbi:ankyrin repeat-containing domain protein [Fusarium oxysporum]|nr:ankyrin repeat-containing domain protein [Fusarium oxysporum]